VLVVIVAAAVLAAPAPQRADARALQAVLSGVVQRETAALTPFATSAHPLAIRAVVVDVDRGVSAGVDGDTAVYLASAAKLFVLMSAYAAAAAGTLRFDEELPFGIDDVRDGSPTLNRRPLGSTFRVDDLLTVMVRDSDNAAFDLLLRRLGEDRVAAMARRFGPAGRIVSTLETRKSVYAVLDPRARDLSAEAIRDVRWRDGFRPRLDVLKRRIGAPFGRYGKQEHDDAWATHYASGLSSAPLSTVAAALVALASGTGVSPAADREMLSLLRHTKTSERRLLGDLPVGTPVAHKTGSLHKRLVDVGVVSLDDVDGGGAVVVAVAVSGVDHEAGEAAIAAVARAAFDAIRHLRRVTPPSPATAP
jgi:beta-lactamase class A